MLKYIHLFSLIFIYGAKKIPRDSLKSLGKKVTELLSNETKTKMQFII